MQLQPKSQHAGAAGLLVRLCVSYVIYEDKRLVLLSNVLRYLSAHFKSAVLGKMNANVAQG